MEKVIIHVKVQSDAVNRTLKLADPEFSTLLEGNNLYDLSLPVVMYDEADAAGLISSVNANIAHA